jgi:TolB-like protein/DNA-binding winged helix-turn-helix (wHTH) protein/Tfp pilus assembly protein PilF
MQAGLQVVVNFSAKGGRSVATPALPPRIRFGEFEADLTAGELRRDGFPEKILLQDQPLAILRTLVAKPGEMVSREELIQLLWNGNTNVDFDPSLNKAVNRLRESLGDSAEAPRYIETLSRRGYRFIARVDGTVEARQTTAANLASSRRWIVVGVGVLLGLIAGVLVLNVGGLRDRFLSRGGSGKKVMLAVLPFENLSNDSDQEYFSDGMTDEMITQLGRLQPDRLGVIARGSVMRYKHNDQAAARVAQELGVQYILEGSVRREGQKVRISAQLVQTSDQTHLWAQDYDGDLSGILALQTRVARDTANEIRLNLTPKAKLGGPSARPVDPEAYQLYLRGRYNLNRIFYKSGDEKLKTAIALFQQAGAKDPSYAPTYAGLGEAYMWAVHKGADRSHDFETEAGARAAAEKALQLDASSAEAHIVMALYLESQWDFSEMEKEARTATELDPNSSWCRQLYGLMLIHEGRLEEAFVQMRLAATQDPFSSATPFFLEHYYAGARDWDHAIEASKAAIKADPDFLMPYDSLAVAYGQKGMIVESVQASSEGARRAGADMAQVNKELEPLRRAYDAGGAQAFRKKDLQLNWEAFNRTGAANPLWGALLCARSGEVDKAFEWLDKAFQKRMFGMIFLKFDSQLDPLHSDPRWNDLLRRVGFPPNPPKP